MYDPTGTVQNGRDGWDLVEYEWDRQSGEGTFKYAHPTRSRPMDVFRLQHRYWLPLKQVE